MTTLSKLKLVNESKQVRDDPVIARRSRLVEALREQRLIAEGLIKGEPVTIYYTGKEHDPETGEERIVRKPKRLRQWFWHNIESVWFLEIRYGNRKLELGKDKTAVEVGPREKLPEVIDALIEATIGGEFDALLEKAARRPKAS